MFTPVLSASLLALASSALAKPLSINRPRQFGGVLSGFGGFGGFGGFDDSISSELESSVSVSTSFQSFDSFDDISSLSGFDNFFGLDNFCGASNIQVFQESEVEVCQSVDVTFIQQQLSIITEFTKRILTTEICEVEMQSIVLSQFMGGFFSFMDDIRRVSSRTVSFDSVIASQVTDLCESDGSINFSPFDFTGSDIGSSSVIINGDNWNSISSPSSVDSAFSAAQGAVSGSLTVPPTSVSVPPTDDSSDSTDVSDDTSDSTDDSTDDSADVVDDSDDTSDSTDDSTDTSDDSADVSDDSADTSDDSTDTSDDSADDSSDSSDSSSADPNAADD